MTYPSLARRKAAISLTLSATPAHFAAQLGESRTDAHTSTVPSFLTVGLAIAVAVRLRVMRLAIVAMVTGALSGGCEAAALVATPDSGLGRWQAQQHEREMAEADRKHEREMAEARRSRAARPKRKRSAASAKRPVPHPTHSSSANGGSVRSRPSQQPALSELEREFLAADVADDSMPDRGPVVGATTPDPAELDAGRRFLWLVTPESEAMQGVAYSQQACRKTADVLNSRLERGRAVCRVSGEPVVFPDPSELVIVADDFEVEVGRFLDCRWVAEAIAPQLRSQQPTCRK